MSQVSPQSINEIHRHSSRHVFALLVRALGDFDLAEDAMQEAFASAMTQWPVASMPENPVSWLVSAGRFKAIDRIRRAAKLGELAGSEPIHFKPPSLLSMPKRRHRPIPTGRRSLHFTMYCFESRLDPWSSSTAPLRSQ